MEGVGFSPAASVTPQRHERIPQRWTVAGL